MQIRKAEENDFDAVRDFYHSMIDAMEGTPFHPKWQKDIYPSRADLKTAIDEQSMYIGVLGDKIASAMVFNHKCSEEYSEAAWPHILTKEQFAVIHMLGVHSDYSRRGYARELVRHAIYLAQAAGLKAIRLDVLKGNVPAERLYESMGFQYIDTVRLFYEDTGRTEFRLYELELV